MTLTAGSRCAGSSSVPS